MKYVVAQEKGGVGKTTTAVNVATVLVQRGRRVLAVDTDPRSAITRQIGINDRDLAVSLVEVMAGQVAAADTVVHDVFGIDVLPATKRLDGVEMSFVAEVGRESFLKDALEPLASSYDDLVIDTPPDLGMLTVNALMVADVVLAPRQRLRRRLGPASRRAASHARQARAPSGQPAPPRRRADPLAGGRTWGRLCPRRRWRPSRRQGRATRTSGASTSSGASAHGIYAS